MPGTIYFQSVFAAAIVRVKLYVSNEKCINKCIGDDTKAAAHYFGSPCRRVVFVAMQTGQCIELCVSVRGVSVCLFVSLSLIDVASAEQTAVSHSALMNIINFDDVDDIERAERYLLATALSTHPTEATLKHLLVSVAASSFFLCKNNSMKKRQLAGYR